MIGLHEAEQEVMIDTPGASPQKAESSTKEQSSDIKAVSKAPGFCLWSCIGVISEEGPCPSTSLLSTPPNSACPLPGVCHEEADGPPTPGGNWTGSDDRGHVPREGGVRSHGGPVATWTRLNSRQPGSISPG